MDSRFVSILANGDDDDHKLSEKFQDKREPQRYGNYNERMGNYQMELQMDSDKAKCNLGGCNNVKYCNDYVSHSNKKGYSYSKINNYLKFYRNDIQRTQYKVLSIKNNLSSGNLNEIPDYITLNIKSNHDISQASSPPSFGSKLKCLKTTSGNRKIRITNSPVNIEKVGNINKSSIVSPAIKISKNNLWHGDIHRINGKASQLQKSPKTTTGTDNIQSIHSGSMNTPLQPCIHSHITLPSLNFILPYNNQMTVACYNDDMLASIKNNPEKSNLSEDCSNSVLQNPTFISESTGQVNNIHNNYNICSAAEPIDTYSHDSSINSDRASSNNSQKSHENLALVHHHDIGNISELTPPYAKGVTVLQYSPSKKASEDYIDKSRKNSPVQKNIQDNYEKIVHDTLLNLIENHDYSTVMDWLTYNFIKTYNTYQINEQINGRNNDYYNAENDSSNIYNEKRSKMKYECPLCGKMLTRSSSLQAHMSIHTKVRPFKCAWEGCSKTFNVKSNLTRHFKLHFIKSKPNNEDH